MKTQTPVRILLTALLTVFFSYILCAQEPGEPLTNKKPGKYKPTNAILIVPAYTAQFPYGAMRDRYGFNNLFGLQIAYKVRRNWIIGAEGNFLFGTQLRERYVVNYISTKTGQFITQNNEIIDLNPVEQGFSLKLDVGKVIPVSTHYPDAGILLMTGFGFLQHKMAFNVRPRDLPQMDKTYRKGYDRMCNGPVLSQFIGGIFMKKGRFISGYAGLQFDLAFTQNRRNFDFYLQQKLSEKRLDMFLGIKIGWVLPIWKQAYEEDEE